jgi:hypothetical protein
MVHELTYGVLSTQFVEFPGVAFGSPQSFVGVNPQSFVDGTIDSSTGNLHLYVSNQGASVIDIATNPEVSLSRSP